jgi:hypothetical protein
LHAVTEAAWPQDHQASLAPKQELKSPAVITTKQKAPVKGHALKIKIGKLYAE